MEGKTEITEQENNSGTVASYAEITGIIENLLCQENVKMFDMALPTIEIERIKGRIESLALVLRKINKITQPDFADWTEKINKKMIARSRLFSA